MTLWREWFRCVHALRGACSRHRTFLWLALVLAAFAVRPDLLGVTSFVRAAFLAPASYPLLLHFFHSNALVLGTLCAAWTRLAVRLVTPLCEGDRLVFVADGLKVPKEGRKMPAVKCLHQESDDNAKSTWIMGHSFQALALLVTAPTGQVVAMPLLARICEGVCWSRWARRRSQLETLASMLVSVAATVARPALLVVDAYYAARTVINPLLVAGHHLLAKIRTNAVAYHLPSAPPSRRRGRPRTYGSKVRLRQLFKAWHTFAEAPSPVYGEAGVVIQYRAVDLLWRPIGKVVRFVLVKHPTRGKIILLCTDLTIAALTIIRLYGLRFKIEVSFKQALHTIGVYAYHFWMKQMPPILRWSGDQDLTDQSFAFQRAVRRKLDAYQRYVQLGCIAQGLLQHLAINFAPTVWVAFKSWLRTMKTDLIPSEMVVAMALRSSFPQFLLDPSTEPAIKKFILDRVDYDRMPEVKMAA